jgi:hypothetical protein
MEVRTEEEILAWEKQCYGMPSRLIDDLISEDAETIYDAGMTLAGHLSNLQERFCYQESEDQTPEENQLRQELNVAKYILFKYIMDKVRGADL